MNIVKAATPSLDKVPPEYRAELAAMEDVADAELWSVTESSADPAQERRLLMLLDKNQRGALTEKERQTLIGLRAAGDRLMLRRSYACLLLKYRGHRIPNLTDPRQRPRAKHVCRAASANGSPARPAIVAVTAERPSASPASD